MNFNKMEHIKIGKTVKLAKKLKKQTTIYMWLEIASVVSFFIALMFNIFVLIINNNVVVGLLFTILFQVIFWGLRIANIVFLIFILISSSALKEDFESAGKVFVFSIVLLTLGWIFAMLILPVIIFLTLLIVYSNKTYKEIVESQNLTNENNDDENVQSNDQNVEKI